MCDCGKRHPGIECGTTFCRCHKMTISTKMNWLWYWHITRRVRNLGIALIFKLPKKVIYWCVVRAAVAVEPDRSPENVTASEMLMKFNY
jgi:hypothetical protein